MSDRLCRAMVVALAFLLISEVAFAQSPVLPQLASIPNLAALNRGASSIFSGTVTAVSQVDPASGAVASMRITLHVDQAVRGVQAGETFTFREWAGLWDSGQRYRPGERVMLFLYPASRLGLTSTVGGTQGRFSIDQAGRILLP